MVLTFEERIKWAARMEYSVELETREKEESIIIGNVPEWGREIEWAIV